MDKPLTEYQDFKCSLIDLFNKIIDQISGTEFEKEEFKWTSFMKIILFCIWYSPQISLS